MSGLCSVFVGDEGTKVLVTLYECDGETAANISSATAINFYFYKPNALDPTTKELITKTGLFDSDGADGKVYYLFEPGFIDVKGTYKFHVKVELPTGKWYSTTDSFRVSDPLGA